MTSCAMCLNGTKKEDRTGTAHSVSLATRCALTFQKVFHDHNQKAAFEIDYSRAAVVYCRGYEHQISAGKWRSYLE